MSTNNSSLFTPGKIVILWRILLILNNNEGVLVKDVVSLLRNLGILGGTLPVKQSIKLGQICGLIDIQNDLVVLTDLCKEKVITHCITYDPNPDVIRIILYQILVKNYFPWILFFDEDPDIFKVAIPQGWIDLLDSASLFNLDDPNVESWWESLFYSLHNIDVNQSKVVGDIGEKLTIEYEKNRLLTEQYKSPWKYVKWVSRYTNSEGYDILSIVGKASSLLKSKDKDEILIEVKSSIASNEHSFNFFLSKNEWNTAIKKIDSYFFYCWLGVNMNAKTAEKGPFIILAKKLISQVPQDISDVCEWTECRFSVDLTKY